MSAPVEEPAAHPLRALRLHRELSAIWATGPGWQRLASVNHTVIGLRMMVTAFVFMLIGGLLGAGGGFLGDRYTKGPEAEVKSGTEFGVMLNQSIALPKFSEATPVNQ